ncbi:MAG: hypothetical protein NC489_23865 [Ruminococcus flavefaciens]|nr:hypothetical protein [Ruminococcus flavefaciens]
MNKSKVSIAMSQVIEKIEKIAGVCCAVFFGLIALVAMFDGSEDPAGMIILMWFLCAAGIAVFMAGQKRTKMRLEFKKYVTQLSVDPSGSLENLASATGTSVDVVKNNLKYMIKKAFFTDAFINEQENELVLLSIAQRSQQQNTSTGTSAQAEMVACTCPCCGGINKIIKGMVGECDFCGSPLMSEK